MYIKNRPATIASKIIITVLSLSVTWYLLGAFGWDAFRLFPTWVSSLSTLYFLGSALFLLLGRKRVPGKNPCPMLEGMIICGFLLMTGLALTSLFTGSYLPHLDHWLIWLLCDILPLLTLADWAVFCKKGRFRPMYPFYWLALPICYAAAMLLSAAWLSKRTPLRYPLIQLDYLHYGIWGMFIWILLVSISVLAGGYLLYLIDFALSGKLAKRIVLPHIVVVEEEGLDNSNSSSGNSDAPTAPSVAKTANAADPQAKPNQEEITDQNKRQKTPPKSRRATSPKSSATSTKASAASSKDEAKSSFKAKSSQPSRRKP